MGETEINRGEVEAEFRDDRADVCSGSRDLGDHNRPSYRPCTAVIALITASGLYRPSMQIAANYI